MTFAALKLRRHGSSSILLKSAEEGIVLTEAQVQVLERKQQDDEVCREIESPHPGYLGSQDTFYVGTHCCPAKHIELIS